MTKLNLALSSSGPTTGRTDQRFTEVAPDQLAELADRLDRAGLPSEDLWEPGRRFYRLDDEAGPIGWAGLEVYGADALLRSVVVADDRHGRGVGRSLVSHAIETAQQLGVGRIWLLTTTAAGFFEKLGFERAERAAAPEAIRTSREFGHICPASATCMVRSLTGE